MIGTLRYLAGEGGIAWHALKLRQAWRATERGSREDLEEFQAEKFAGVLRAARRAPYWRGLLAGAGGELRGESLREQLRGLPVLTKSVVRQQDTNLLADDSRLRGVQWCRTGGTTGEPLRVARDTGARAAVMAACLRGFGWLGVQPGDATVQVRGFDRLSFLGRLRCHAGNFRLVDPFATGVKAADILQVIRQFHPACLMGYPTSLLKLAGLAERESLRVPVVFCTGEMLPASQRRRLAAVFGGRVAEYYGSNEVGGLAFECEQGRLHVSEEHVLVETVDEAGQPVWERPGRILVTDLDNQIMPLLRYELGDIGVLTREPCACGRSLLVLRQVQGRCQDCLRNAQGDILPAMFFAEQSRHLSGISAYQLVQRQLDEIELRYVVGGPMAEAEAEGLCHVIRRQLGPQMRITREVCAQISLTPRGKSRLVVGLA
jgi:phenylacetate-CoA ligase